MPQQYDPLSQEDDSHIDDAEPDSADRDDSPRTELLPAGPRPAIYYGEGPFNAPSSDEEDEEGEAEKAGIGSLDRAEHGGLLGSGGLADGGLYVGRTVSLRAQQGRTQRAKKGTYLMAHTLAGTPVGPGASPRARCALDALRGDRSLCSFVLQRREAHRTRQ